MKKSIFIAITVFLIVLGVIIKTPNKVYAYSASIAPSSNTVTEGETFSVTVNFGRGVSAVQFSLSYPSNIEYVSKSTGTYDTGSKQFGIFGANDDVSRVTFTFRAKNAGKATISANGVSLSYGEDTYNEPAGSPSTTININTKPTPTPTPTPAPTEIPQEPQQPNTPNQPQQPNTPTQEQPKVTEAPKASNEPTPTPTQEQENNETENNENNENDENTSNDTNNNVEKAQNKIIKIDDNDAITLKNEVNDVMIKSEKIAIKDENVTLSVKQIEEDSSDRYKSLSSIVKNIKGNKKYYDIKILKDGLAIDTNGYVTIYLPISEGENKDKIEIYSINEQTKKAEKKDIEIQGNYYTFTTDNLEEAYTIVEQQENTKSSKVKKLFLMILGAIVIITVIIIFMKKIS